MALATIEKNDQISLYDAGPYRQVGRLVASTPETRSICNDPFVVGINYTDLLRTACAKVLKSLVARGRVALAEDDTSVLHVLRGGLNFGLREALGISFGWNNHASAYISAQRARKQPKSEDWIITESSYRKIHLKKRNNIVFGDVVATGTSLEYALKRLTETAKETGSVIESLVFFTIGGQRSHEILAAIDDELRASQKNYRGSTVVYFEGVFSVASAQGFSDRPKLSISIDGTDLLRTRSILAAEFLESQYQNSCYPLERCTIYDAGSRAFDTDQYFLDIKDYWTKTLALAEKGMSFSALLAERFPELDARRFGASPDLAALCKSQLAKIPALDNSMPAPSEH